MMVKRTFKRRFANSFFGIYETKTEQFVGFLVDMTVAGLKLESSTAIDTEAIFEFRIDLPVEVEGSRDLTFRAKSIWCKAVKDRGHWETGFEMHDLPESELRKIVSLVEGPLFDDADSNVRISLSKIRLPKA